MSLIQAEILAALAAINEAASLIPQDHAWDRLQAARVTLERVEEDLLVPVVEAAARVPALESALAEAQAQAQAGNIAG